MEKRNKGISFWNFHLKNSSAKFTTKLSPDSKWFDKTDREHSDVVNGSYLVKNFDVKHEARIGEVDDVIPTVDELLCSGTEKK